MFAEPLKRSVLGLCSVFNALPARVVHRKDPVCLFQRRLQEEVKQLSKKQHLWKAEDLQSEGGHARPPRLAAVKSEPKCSISDLTPPSLEGVRETQVEKKQK